MERPPDPRCRRACQVPFDARNVDVSRFGLLDFFVAGEHNHAQALEGSNLTAKFSRSAATIPRYQIQPASLQFRGTIGDEIRREVLKIGTGQPLANEFLCPLENGPA